VFAIKNKHQDENSGNKKYGNDNGEGTIHKGEQDHNQIIPITHLPKVNHLKNSKSFYH
jgi:hypothetical protein